MLCQRKQLMPLCVSYITFTVYNAAVPGNVCEFMNELINTVRKPVLVHMWLFASYMLPCAVCVCVRISLTCLDMSAALEEAHSAAVSCTVRMENSMRLMRLGSFVCWTSNSFKVIWFISSETSSVGPLLDKSSRKNLNWKLCFAAWKKGQAVLQPAETSRAHLSFVLLKATV